MMFAEALVDPPFAVCAASVVELAGFDALAHQAPLHGFSEELTAAVGLDTLNRKRHFLYDTIKEKQRISTRIDGQYTKA